MDENEAPFGHLQSLMDLLPEMQEKGEKLAQARAAVEVAKRVRYAQGQQNELAGIVAAMDEHSAARDAAIAAGDAEREEAERAQILMLGNERGIRKGAADSAQRAVERALSEGGFEDADQALAAELPEEELAALAAEVESYQADYAETLDECLRLHAEEGVYASEGVEEA